MDDSAQPLWLAVIAASLGIITSVVSALFVANPSTPLIVVMIASVVTLLLLVTFELANRTVVRQVRIALIGAPGVGKTVYVTSLFDTLQTARNFPLRFAPSSETIDRVLATLGGYARGQWASRTPGDYLYIYSARLAAVRSQMLARLFGATEYELQLADAAGEQLGEFVPGESRWATKTSYYQYAVDSHVLFLFLDYPSLVGPPIATQKPLVDQVNDLIFVIQDVCEANGVGPADQLKSPVAVVISKSDLAEEKRPHELMRRLSEESRDLQRLLAVARSRCQWVELFAVSSTGPLDDPKYPPTKLHPIEVDTPLRWALRARYRIT